MTTGSTAPAPPAPAAPEGAAGAPARTRGRTAVIWLLGALLLALPTISLPQAGWWLGLKAFVLEAAGILLALIVVVRGGWSAPRLWAVAISGPNPAVAAFLFWAALSALASPLPEQSRYEFMRHVGGGLVYFAVVYGLSPRRQLRATVRILAAAAGVAALFAFINYGESDATRVAGAFRNQQLLAAFLCLLLPVLLMAAEAEDALWARSWAQIAVVLVAAGILVARNRSAWIGTLAAVVILAALYLRYSLRGRSRPQKHHVVIPALMLALCAALFLGTSRMGGLLSERAGSLAGLRHEGSIQWRLGMWDKAARMTRARPWQGWGVGTFPVQQALFHHPTSRGRDQLEIVTAGPGLAENAHNSYLQLAAEMGLPGLALYLGILAGFFVTAWRALPGARGYARAILMGAIAGIAGQAVCAFGSPAWEFPECSLFFWLVLGLGMLAAGLGDRGARPN